MKLLVRDVMTSTPISVELDAGFKQMVEILETNRISALPVVDRSGTVMGVVSEADLLLKEEHDGTRGARWFESSKRRAAQRKQNGETARDFMSSPAITATTDMPVAAAARLMHERGVKRLPVVDGAGRLAGILTRSDALKVFLRSDAELRREVVEDVIVHSLWMDPEPIRVDVSEGVVELSGQVERRSDVNLLSELVGSLDGVVAVHADGLTYRYQDN